MTASVVQQRARQSTSVQPLLFQPGGSQVPDVPIARRASRVPVWARAVISAAATGAIIWFIGAAIVIASMLLFWIALVAFALGFLVRRRTVSKRDTAIPNFDICYAHTES